MIYHVYANKSNIGDWLSARGIQSAIADNPIRELLCDAPFVDDTIRTLRTVSPNDLVVIGGGGLFMDYFTTFWERLLELNDVFFGLWGVGFCDITQENSRPPLQLIEEVVRRSRFCYVRDELTRRYLDKFTLPPPVGCPTVLYLTRASRMGRGLLHVDNYTTVGDHAFEEMDRIGRQFAAGTNRPYWQANNHISAGNEEHLQTCLQSYRNSDVVLSSALHGCIIGAALGCKIIAVSGDRKIDSFMRGIGLDSWGLRGNSEVSKLPELLSNIEMQEWPSDSLRNMRICNEEVCMQVLNVARNLKR